MNVTKRSAFLIAAINIVGQIIGAYLGIMGKPWYRTLQLPTITPPDWVFSVVWTIIYILTGICAIMVWNQKQSNPHRSLIMVLFGINLVLNLSWCYLFFGLHMIFAPLVIAVIEELSVLHLIYMINPVSKKAAYLLLPYALWGGFAIWLNYLVWALN
jgi:tryptophan-rich sensory protein